MESFASQAEKDAALWGLAEWLMQNREYHSNYEWNEKYKEFIDMKSVPVEPVKSAEIMPKDIDVFLSQYPEREWLKIHGDLHDLLPFFKKCIRPAMHQYAAQSVGIPTEKDQINAALDYAHGAREIFYFKGENESVRESASNFICGVEWLRNKLTIK